MEKEKISFEQFCNPEFRRDEQMKVKSEAVWVTFLELGGLLNISKFAKEYLHKSGSWFQQKLRGNCVNGKLRSFTPEEYIQIANALRGVAKRLEEYADAIDTATIE